MDYIPFLAREPTLVEKVTALITQPFHAIYHPLQAIISLPAIFFLIIPAFSSYSTTLNFLFFYMTWVILIRTNSPLQVELLGTLATRVLFYILPSSAFLAFDSLFPNVAKSFKEHGEDALALGEYYGGRWGRWWRITLISLLNVTISVLLQTAIDLILVKILDFRSAIKISTSLPLPWNIVKDLALALALREVLTYMLHRYVLHGLGSKLKQWHESWQHSILAPFSFVAHYDHPVPYLVRVFLPMYLPAALLRMHLLTHHVYLIIICVEETFAYSGYNVLPTAFILGGIARRQERHLMGDGKGNFGCFGLADFVMGTSLGDDLMDDVVDEAEEKQVGKKARGKAKGAKKKAQRRLPSSHDDDDDSSEAPHGEPAPSRSRSRRQSRERPAKTSKNDVYAENDPREKGEVKLKRKPNGTKKSNGRAVKRTSDDG